MKISEFLKKLGIDLDGELVETNSETLKVDNVVKNNENVENRETEKKQVETPVKEEKQEAKKMILPKYDEKSGLFSGVNEIEDEGLKQLLKTVNNSVKAKANQAKIDGAIKGKLDTLKLIDGVTSDAVIKLLDTTGIKIQDDEVIGVNEAFDNLVKSQAGLFKQNKETKEQASPVLEGFSKPMDNTSPFSEDDLVNYAFGQE